MPLAPIVLFVFDRPELTKKTLESLANNSLLKESTLYIFADGPKENADSDRLSRINDVHSIINSFDASGKCYVEISKDNKGLKRSILDGVTKVIAEHQKAIILEDDLILSPIFLEYMNKALNIYEESEKVYCINGHNFGNGEGFPETFFHQVPHSWGWATWKSKWDQLRLDTQKLYNEILPFKNRFNLDNNYDFFRQLKANYDGSLNTWAIYWYSTIFLNNGICLTPGKTLVQNIGFGENATNTKYSGKDLVESETLSNSIEVKIIEEKLDQRAIKLIKEYYSKRQDPLLMKIAKFIYFDLLFFIRKKNK